MLNKCSGCTNQSNLGQLWLRLFNCLEIILWFYIKVWMPLSVTIQPWSTMILSTKLYSPWGYINPWYHDYLLSHVEVDNMASTCFEFPNGPRIPGIWTRDLLISKLTLYHWANSPLFFAKHIPFVQLVPSYCVEINTIIFRLTCQSFFSLCKSILFYAVLKPKGVNPQVLKQVSNGGC